ncbi:MAG: Na+/H+ antiporter subunit D [Devosia sp.]|uniref:proton-conducting transporter transmembrane domain-containing protein n=1 Tax=Devosia sp. TaxID=1871048 RepID=UPI001A439931|nr:proton-conducting transporter membrane subunit [Devosia sp.]MBL8596291.1 Na+/H+ antiporter subunit D [Devosia sp.]
MIEHVTPPADWVIILPVVLCLMGAALLLMLRGALRVQLWVTLAVILAVLVCDALLFNRVMQSGPLGMTMGKWLPPFGISFTADVLGASFALAGAVATLCVVLYLQGDTPEAAVRDGVYPLVLLLLAGVTGAFLTGDLFNLYVWFEVMLIASFGLIVLAGHPLQLDAAVKYGILNFLATTLFLMGLGLLYGLLGTLNMADAVGAAARADAAPLTAIGALFALAFGMKAAVFPVNAWLPASYHAPPPAISALMGGLLTKVGIYALLRTLVMLLPVAREHLAPVLLALAIATAILGPLSAIAETGLRRAIGFMLIGGVGLMLLSVAGVAPEAIAGSIAYGVHAILTLTGLYLVAGLIERATGQGDTRQMRGLYAANSSLSILFFVLVLAVSGVPPFLGFWPKLLLLQGFVGATDWLAVFTVLLNALLTLIAGSRLWSHIFWRGTAEKAALSPSPMMATWTLAIVVVVLGLAPAILVEAATIAARDLLDPARYIASVGLSP